MKKFVELIQRVHKERFKVVVNKLIDEKIPVTFLSVEPFEKMLKKLQEHQKWFNITNFITLTPPPPPHKIFSLISK